MSRDSHAAASDRLVPYAEALKTVLANVRTLPAATLPLGEALGAYLARPARARSHSPRFEQSSMDGFAVKLDDLAAAREANPVGLHLAGTLAAGDARRLQLKRGQTVKVFTGSRLPGGTEAVVMQEHVMLEGDVAHVAWRPAPGEHIRRVGEEYRRGDEILPSGIRVTPPVVGMLVLLGRKNADVVRRPSVAVITMGDELVAPGEKPGPGQIPDANGPAICAALRGLGVLAVHHTRVKDDPVTLNRAVADGLSRCDLIVTVGGASVGEFDHVPRVWRELKVRELFTRVAIRPGKPNWFGLGPGRKPVFGLPGNTVSALVSFHQLVKPAVLKMMGAPTVESDALFVRLALLVQQHPGRMAWLRARILDNGAGPPVAELETGQGSHMLSGLARAEVLVELSAESAGAEADTVLPARKLEWFP